MKYEIECKDLQGKIEVYFNGLGYYLVYITEEMEVISRDTLKEISLEIDYGTIYFYTNAGVDIHSSESSTLHGISVIRIPYHHKSKVIERILDLSIIETH